MNLNKIISKPERVFTYNKELPLICRFRRQTLRLSPTSCCFLDLLLKQNALEWAVSPFAIFFQNIRELGDKKYFTDYRIANTTQ